MVETAAKSARLWLSDLKWAVTSELPPWAKLNVDVYILLHLTSQSTQDFFRKGFSFCKSRLNVHFRFGGIFKVMSTVQSIYYRTVTKITVIILNLSYQWRKQKPAICVVTWFSYMTSFATFLKINIDRHWFTVARSLTLLSAQKSKRYGGLRYFNEAVCSNANAGQIRDSQAKSGQLSVPGEVSVFPGHPVENRDCPGKSGTDGHLTHVCVWVCVCAQFCHWIPCFQFPKPVIMGLV